MRFFHAAWRITKAEMNGAQADALRFRADRLVERLKEAVGEGANVEVKVYPEDDHVTVQALSPDWRSVVSDLAHSMDAHLAGDLPQRDMEDRLRSTFALLQTYPARDLANELTPPSHFSMDLDGFPALPEPDGDA